MEPSIYLLPLLNVPQSFTISMAGTIYNMVSKWNDSPDGGWVLDISDVNNNSLASNIPLITGADCLSGLSYLGINGVLFVFTDGNDFAVPTLANLGVESNPYFISTAASQ